MALTDIDGQRLGDSVSDKLGDRNLIINGAMQVAQRGTSAANLGNADSNYHTVDRFRFGEQGAPTCEFTNTQSTDAPSGFSNSFRFDTTTAESPIGAANTIYTDYRVEAQDLQRLGYGTNDAKSITLSFYVKSTVSGTYVVWFYNPDGAVACTHTYTIAPGEVGTWQYRTISVTGDTSNVIDNDNGVGMFIRFVLCAGTDWTSGTASTTWAGGSVTDANRFPGHTANIAASTDDDWSITGVQLEVGNTATPFEHESYAKTLAKCERYYQVICQGADQTLANASYYETFRVFAVYPLRTTMRADPSLDIEGDQTSYVIFRDSNSDICNKPSFGSRQQPGTIELDFNTNVSGTAGHGAFIRTNDATTYTGDLAFIAANAEL